MPPGCSRPPSAVKMRHTPPPGGKFKAQSSKFKTGWKGTGKWTGASLFDVDGFAVEDNGEFFYINDAAVQKLSGVLLFFDLL